MLALRGFAKRFTPENQRGVDNEEEFVPTLMNSCMFLNELSSFLSTNILNFEGRPFMKSLSEYKGHFKLIMAPLVLLVVLIFESFPTLNQLFQMNFSSTHSQTNLALFLIVFGSLSL